MIGEKEAGKRASNDKQKDYVVLLHCMSTFRALVGIKIKKKKRHWWDETRYFFRVRGYRRVRQQGSKY